MPIKRILLLPPATKQKTQQQNLNEIDNIANVSLNNIELEQKQIYQTIEVTRELNIEKRE